MPVCLRYIATAVLALCPVPSAFAAAPTFAHEVAPILYAHCASCHHAGGAAPFPLLRYEDVKKRADLVMRTTGTRYMPPWLPEQGYGTFAHEQRLSNQDIQTIADWVHEGAPEGPVGDIPPPPEFANAWQLGTPDLILEASAPFDAPASGPDLYWNFVFRPQITARRYVRAIEIRPGSPSLVHHANLLIDRLGVAHQHEIASSHGFPGMHPALFRSPFDPDGHFLFWKPGGPPRVEANGFAWRLDPGNELVLNTHFHPTGKAEAVRPSLGLYFTSEPQTRFPFIFELENDEALRIPAGARDFVVSDAFTLPIDVDVLAVYPHAHYLGHVLEAWAILPNGSRVWLIRIPNWDPAWQSIFEYASPVSLPKGSRIEMRYRYDNSAANIRNPNHPPKLVQAGNESVDEMAHLWLRVLPRGSGDRRRELEEAVLRHRIDKNPRDFSANLNLGAVLLSRLNAPGAITVLETAVAVDPRSSEAHNMLGLALAQVGRTRDAIAHYQAALKLKPNNPSARFNLANAEIKAGDLDSAIDNLQEVLAALPDDVQAGARLKQALALRAAAQQQGR